jgi:hypothetical protein
VGIEAEITDVTAPRGADLIIDCVGASNLARKIPTPSSVARSASMASTECHTLETGLRLFDAQFIGCNDQIIAILDAHWPVRTQYPSMHQIRRQGLFRFRPPYVLILHGCNYAVSQRHARRGNARTQRTVFRTYSSRPALVRNRTEPHESGQNIRLFASCEELRRETRRFLFFHRSRRRRCFVPQGDKSAYTDKQKRKAEHIEEGYEDRGVSEKEAERRAWATVNKESGGGKKSKSGRGHAENHASSEKGGRKGGAATASRTREERSASAKKAAATRKRNERHAHH